MCNRARARKIQTRNSREQPKNNAPPFSHVSLVQGLQKRRHCEQAAAQIPDKLGFRSTMSCNRNLASVVISQTLLGQNGNECKKDAATKSYPSSCNRRKTVMLPAGTKLLPLLPARSCEIVLRQSSAMSGRSTSLITMAELFDSAGANASLLTGKGDTDLTDDAFAEAPPRDKARPADPTKGG